MFWERDQYKIDTKVGPLIVDGLSLNNKIGINFDPYKQISVTHIASGKRICAAFKQENIFDAFNFAERISTLIDWSVVKPDTSGDIGARIKEIRSSYDSME